MMGTRRLLLFLLPVIVSGCAQAEAPPAPANHASAFQQLTDDFLYGSLALSPVFATSTGYHEHNGIRLDEQLDDYSAAGLDAQRRWYDDLQKRLGAFDAASLDKEQQADLAIARNAVGLALLDLNTIQSFLDLLTTSA